MCLLYSIGNQLTELVLFFKVHVHDASRPHTRHLASVQSADFGEKTRTRCVAAILGKEDRHIVLCKILGLLVVAGLRVGRVATPRIDVVTPEVNGILGFAAIEVVGHVFTDGSVIVGGIPDTDRAVVLALDVGLGVANSGFDESTSYCVVRLVGYLIAGKETERVVIFDQLVNNAGVAFVELDSPSRVVSINRGSGLGQICNDVDACVCECVHAGTVVLGRIDSIYTNRVGRDLLKVFNVALACCAIGKGIGNLDLV